MCVAQKEDKFTDSIKVNRGNRQRICQAWM